MTSTTQGDLRPPSATHSHHPTADGQAGAQSTPKTVLSGHCGIRRHHACRGAYGGAQCPCACHQVDPRVDRLAQVLASALSWGDWPALRPSLQAQARDAVQAVLDADGEAS
jgi:hypothetical protein